jgi:hypothetical protein
MCKAEEHTHIQVLSTGAGVVGKTHGKQTGQRSTLLHMLTGDIYLQQRFDP